MKKTIIISEERYRSIIEDQPDVIRRFLPDGTITFANDAYCNFFMRRKEYVIGENLYRWCTKEVEEVIRQSVAGLTPEYPVTTYDRPVQLRDGEWRWVQWINRAFFDENGNPIEYQSTGRDITDLKINQIELSKRNNELAALNAIGATLIQRSDLRKMLDSALEKMLEVMELDGGWIYLLEEREGSKFMVQFAQRGLPISKNDPPININLESIKLDLNSTSSALITAVNSFHLGHFARIPMPTPDIYSAILQGRENPMGILGVCRKEARISPQQQDVLATIGRQMGVIIENIQLEKKNSDMAVIHEVNRIHSELIANVSHEMKTPLGLILIMATAMMRDEIKFDPEMARATLQDICSEVNNLNEIVDNLLSISRYETKKECLQKVKCNLQELVERVIKNLEAQAANHHILVDFPPHPLVADVDEKQIEQVMRNLIINAIKYSPTGTDITISGGQVGNDVLIKVDDKGIGIPPEDLDHVFDRFYRVNNDRVKESPGIGLGLSICREIIEAHYGKIWVESVPDRGSNFYFSIPSI